MEREAAAGGPLVRGFAAGGFRIDERVLAAVLLTPERAEVWSPPPLERLEADALAPLLDLEPAPEFVLLGTGDTLVRPPQPLIAALEAKGIGVEPMDSRAAARAWGVLRTEGRWIAAALYSLG